MRHHPEWGKNGIGKYEPEINARGRLDFFFNCSKCRSQMGSQHQSQTVQMSDARRKLVLNQDARASPDWHPAVDPPSETILLGECRLRIWWRTSLGNLETCSPDQPPRCGYHAGCPGPGRSCAAAGKRHSSAGCCRRCHDTPKPSSRYPR